MRTYDFRELRQRCLVWKSPCMACGEKSRSDATWRLYVAYTKLWRGAFCGLQPSEPLHICRCWDGLNLICGSRCRTATPSDKCGTSLNHWPSLLYAPSNLCLQVARIPSSGIGVKQSRCLLTLLCRPARPNILQKQILALQHRVCKSTRQIRQPNEIEADHRHATCLWP